MRRNLQIRVNFRVTSVCHLDAKKSPLALLAQTCSQIGADVSCNKPIHTTSESKQRSKQNSQRDKYSPGTITSTGNTSTSTNCDSTAVSPFRDVSRRNSGSNLKDDDPNAAVPRHSTHTPTSSSSILSSRQPTSSPSRTSKKTVTLKVPSPTTPSSIAEKYSHKLEINSAAKVRNPSSYSIPTTHYDVASSALLGVSSIQGQISTLSPGTLINPYPMYSFHKSPMGGTATGEPLIPLYRDPFCVGCRLGTHLPHPMPVSGGETCGPNCNQCEKHNAVLAAAVSNLSSQFAVSALLAHALPFVCNWVVGEGQCGRRFSNSEELLHHLTSHMNVTVSSPSTIVTSSTQQSPHAPPILPLLSPSHTLLSPVQTQLRAYPTPPLSPLGSRFHPYTKPQVSSTQTPSHVIPVTPYMPFPPYLYFPRTSSIHQ
ncbi:hypothetical protein J437_LFUL008628 [Ladona fulva]|uniref:C2H2-type domain-containing protein n=1 Tax=Ladona fulva TaxID=123851 RepID=A0A8K0K4H6_LADFU|nr:hypothetical protein J437_LFUL008628 [Ladona fulva]